MLKSVLPLAILAGIPTLTLALIVWLQPVFPLAMLLQIAISAPAWTLVIDRRELFDSRRPGDGQNVKTYYKTLGCSTSRLLLTLIPDPDTCFSIYSRLPIAYCLGGKMMPIMCYGALFDLQHFAGYSP